MPFKSVWVYPILLFTLHAVTEEDTAQSGRSDLPAEKDFWFWFDEFANDKGEVIDPLDFSEAKNLCLEQSSEISHGEIYDNNAIEQSSVEVTRP